MDQSRADIAHERRRMMQVRRTFQALAEPVLDAEAGLVEAGIACADYLVFSLGRLHAQDEGIHARLKSRIPVADADAHRRLADLEAQQQRSRRLVASLADDARSLRRKGTAGLPAFLQAARDFGAGMDKLSAQGRNPFRHYTEALLSERDWAEIAGASDASRARENELFDRVCRAVPERADPRTLSADH